MHVQLREGLLAGIGIWALTLIIFSVVMYFSGMSGDIGFFLLIGGPIFLAFAIGMPVYLHKFAMARVHNMRNKGLLGKFTFLRPGQGKIIHTHWAHGVKTRSETLPGFKVVQFGNEVILYDERYLLIDAKNFVNAEVVELPGKKLQLILELALKTNVKVNSIGMVPMNVFDRYEFTVPSDQRESAELLAKHYFPK
ncbi:MAG: hypothetical protein KKB51_03550 [Candidatus Riflebacteria bacterium]|nr:hypothetical protein [Candidatus Riflebacteria bacterium]